MPGSTVINITIMAFYGSLWRLCDEENVKTVLARVDKWSNAVGERHRGNWSYRSVNCMGERSSMNSMGERGSVNSMGDRSVDGVNAVGDNSISSVKSVGGVSHDGGVGSEGLALGGGPVLSLVGLAHGLVAHLAVSVSIDGLVGAIVDGGDGSGHGGGQHGGVSNGVVSDSVVSKKLGGSRGHGGKGEKHKSLEKGTC